MPYIGKLPEHGRYGKLDQINGTFNGSSNVTFNLTVDSEAVYPTNPQTLIISLNGVIQQPGTDFTVSVATITFTTAPASGVGFFGVLLGDTLDIGTPSDGSVTVTKMAANSVDSDQYVDGSIDRVHLAADIIDGTKIDDDVINSEHYVAGSIDNEHLADNAVNSDELAAGAVDIAHLSASGTANNSVFLRGDNTWAAAGGTFVTVIKNSSQTFTTETLADDTDLTFSVGANEDWAFMAVIISEEVGQAGADLRNKFTGPSGSTLTYAVIGPAVSISDMGNVSLLHMPGTKTGASFGTGNSSDAGTELSTRVWWGSVLNGSTSGSVTLQSAKFSPGGNQVVLQGSFITAWKVA